MVERRMLASAKRAEDPFDVASDSEEVEDGRCGRSGERSRLGDQNIK